MSEPFAMQIMERGWQYGDPRPRFVWAPTKAHRLQAVRNHGQSLERLNERGGLCWSELEGILRGIGWGQLRKDQEAARQVCLSLFPQTMAA